MDRRILVFLPTLGSHFRGGTASMATAMAQALRDMGHEAEIVRFDAGRAILPQGKSVERDGITFTRFDSFHARFIGFHNLPRGPQWRRYLAGFDAAISVCGSPYGSLALLEGSGAPPLAVWAAVTIREDLKGRFDAFSPVKQTAYRLILPLIERQEKAVLRRCRHLWALSDDTMRHFERMGETSRSPMSILFAPIDTEHFRPAAGPSLAERPTAVFTARYGDARKNAAFLLRAFARVVAQVPEARLVLIGDDNPPEALRRIVRERGLSDNVELRASMKRSDLPDALRQALVFALPSHQEGLCISALEAMACGLPVVSTRCGGPESYVIDGQTGYLVDQGDEEAMARRLADVLSNEALQADLANRARAFVQEHCAPSAFRDKVGAVLDGIWQERGR